MRTAAARSEGGKNVPGRLDGGGDVGLAVGRAHKAGFIQGRRDVDTAVEQAVKEFVEFRAVAGHDGGVVLRQFWHQEEAENTPESM